MQIVVHEDHCYYYCCYCMWCVYESQVIVVHPRMK